MNYEGMSQMTPFGLSLVGFIGDVHFIDTAASTSDLHPES